jgi:glyoxylase-like metal-dependent hydrolase (beta-lactamase superfamily II)
MQATRFQLFALAAVTSACAVTNHAVRSSADLGTPRRTADMLAVIDQPGPLEVETVNSADWAVPRSGLIDLSDPKAKAAHLQDGDEPIQVYFHVIRHPTKGTFIVDTGVERALRDAPDKSAPGWLIRSFMHLEKLKVHVPLSEWLASQPVPLSGVFLTHMHLDHMTGMPDVPHGTPIYVGPTEAHSRSFMNLFTQGTADRQLAGQAPVQEWPFRPDPDGRFDGVVDVFGDGTLWALWVPGHTPGSVAYLARTTRGPVLFVGDTSHTAWGWNEGVAPGAFTADHRKNAESLTRLHELVAEHPRIDVRLGHQSLAGVSPGPSAATALLVQ